MFYKNTSSTVNTFYGVTFRPNEIKEVPGYINDPNFERVSSLPVEPPKGDKARKVIEKQSNEEDIK